MPPVCRLGGHGGTRSVVNIGMNTMKRNIRKESENKVTMLIRISLRHYASALGNSYSNGPS